MTDRTRQFIDAKNLTIEIINDAICNNVTLPEWLDRDAGQRLLWQRAFEACAEATRDLSVDDRARALECLNSWCWCEDSHRIVKLLAERATSCEVLITPWPDDDQLLVFGKVDEGARFRVEIGVTGLATIGGEWCATLEEAKQAGTKIAESLSLSVRSVVVF